jgi:hypothetical protein
MTLKRIRRRARKAVIVKLNEKSKYLFSKKIN